MKTYINITSCFFIIMAFFIIPLQQIKSQDCSITSKANDIIPDQLCAPVNLSWEVTYRGVNNNGTKVEIQFDWDDGNPPQTVTATETDPALDEWKATVTHTYPKGGDKCNYKPTATLVVNGVKCTSTSQEQNVTVWDTDDENGGDLQIAPAVYEVCVGNSVTINFNDVSQWNCTPPDENDVPNNKARWIQWIYGTQNDGRTKIKNVEVDGTIVNPPTPLEGPVQKTPEPILGPIAPYNESKQIFVPNTANVGEVFEITLRNWNYCNPYDDPDIPGGPTDVADGDYAPKITRALIVVVAPPDATIDPAGPFCANDAPVNLSAATGGGTWKGPGITNNSTGRFDPSVAGDGTHDIIYTVSNGACTSSDTMAITVYKTPQSNITPVDPGKICPSTDLQINGNPTPGDGAITSNQWSGDIGKLSATNIPDPVFNSTTEGTFNFVYTIEDNNNCVVSENYSIQVKEINVNPLPDPAEVCAENTLQLNGNPAGGSENYIYHQWTGDTIKLNKTNIQKPEFISNSQGTFNYEYKVSDDRGCSDSANMKVDVFPLPKPDAGNDDSTCSLSFNLDASTPDAGGQWFFVSGTGNATFSDKTKKNTTVNVDAFGVYQFAWQDSTSDGCTKKDTVKITFFKNPVANAGNNKDTCGFTHTLDATKGFSNGYWKLYKGPGKADFQDSLKAVTKVTVDSGGEYKFIWNAINGPCKSRDTVKVNFKTSPEAAYTASSISGCNPLEVNFNNQSKNGNNFKWDFDNDTLSTVKNPSHTFYNNSTAKKEFHVKLKVSDSQGCHDSTTKTIRVYPLPSANFTSDAKPGCSPLDVNFNNKSILADSSFWNYDDGSKIDTVFDAQHQFKNDTTFIKFHNVNLTVKTKNGCIDSTNEFITVYPVPENDFSIIPDSACHPSQVQLSTDPGSKSYRWEYGDGTAETTSDFNVTHTYNNFSNNDTNYTVTLITNSSFNCKDTTVKKLTVHNTPDASFNIDKTKGCSPLTVRIKNTSTNADIYKWKYNDSTVTNKNDSTYTITFKNNTSSNITRNIKLIAITEDGCKDSINQTVKISPNISANFEPITGGCSPVKVNFNNTSFNATGYKWDFGDGSISNQPSPSHTFNNSTLKDTSYQVKLMAFSAEGCKDTTTRTLDTLKHETNAKFTINKSKGCAPLKVQIKNKSKGAAINKWFIHDSVFTKADTIFSWEFNNKFNNKITREIKLITTTSSGCKDSINRKVETYPSVIANFDSVKGGCSPLKVKLNNTSFNAQGYSWNFGNGITSNAEEPEFTYENNTLNDTAYTIKLIALSSFGCNDTARQLVKPINPKPRSDFSLQQNSGCPPLKTKLTNFSKGNNGNNWIFDSEGKKEILNSNDSVIHHTFQNNNTSKNKNYTVKLLVNNDYGCKDTSSKNVEIFPKTTAGFEFENPVCAPYNVHFHNRSNGADKYRWDFGDGKISFKEEPEHAYSNNLFKDTSFFINLIAKSNKGCHDTISEELFVHHSPKAQFSLDKTTGCSPLKIDINNKSQGSDQYNWLFGQDTSYIEDTLQFSQMLYNETGNTKEIPIKLIASTNKGCKDTLSKQVSVYPDTKADFEATKKGCSPFSPEIKNLSKNASNYLWNFGNGKTSGKQEPEPEYDIYSRTDTSFNMELITLSGFGCNDTTYQEITIKSTPEARFTASPKNQVFPESDVFVKNKTNKGPWNYEWNFGDKIRAQKYQPDTHTYRNYGKYSIQLSVNGKFCSDTAREKVNIIPPQPIADFKGKKEGCQPLKVQFENKSQYAENFQWKFGDGKTSTKENPEHTYFEPGTYTVTLSISNPSGKDKMIKEAVIQVFKKPVAKFKIQPQKVTIPNDPLFANNLSIDANRYIWNFGDGKSSQKENPLHYYKSEGNYEITLIAISNEKCRDTFKVKDIIARKGGKMKVPNAFTPSLDGPANSNINQDGTNDLFYPVTEGVVKMHMQIYNRWGELIFETNDPNKGWNGYYKGELCKQDVYVYKIWAKFADGEVKEKVGNVTLIR